VQNGNGGAWLPQAGPALGFGLPFGPGGRPPGLSAGPGFGRQSSVGGRQAAPSGPPSGRGGMPFGGRLGAGAFTFAGDQWNSLDPGLVRYLEANQGAARFLVATPTSSYASLFMLASDQPAMALGGYQGWDRILDRSQLASLVADDSVRFFLLDARAGRSRQPDDQDATAELASWVHATCAVVPAAQWQTGRVGAQPGRGPGLQGPQLYDCAPAAADAT
jgi:hypothetical protein